MEPNVSTCWAIYDHFRATRNSTDSNVSRTDGPAACPCTSASHRLRPPTEAWLRSRCWRAEKMVTDGGFQLAMGVAQVRWMVFFMEDPNLNWMMKMGVPL